MTVKKNVIISIILTFLCLSVSGCATVIKYDDTGQKAKAKSSGIYFATKADFEFIDKAFNSPDSNWFKELAIILTPFAVIDIPFSLVFDTVTLPNDIYTYYRDKELEEFWASVLLDNKEYNGNELSEKYTFESGYYINRLIRNSILDERSLKIAFDVISSNPYYKTVNKSPDSIYQQSVNYPNLKEYICLSTASKMAAGQRSTYIQWIVEDDDDVLIPCIAKMESSSQVPCLSLVKSDFLSGQYLRRCYSSELAKHKKHIENINLLSDVERQISMRNHLYAINFLRSNFVRSKNLPLDLANEFAVDMSEDFTSAENSTFIMLIGKTKNTNVINSAVEMNDFKVDLAIATNVNSPKVVHDRLYEKYLRKSDERELDLIQGRLAYFTRSEKLMEKLIQLDEHLVYSALLKNSSSPNSIHEEIYASLDNYKHRYYRYILNALAEFTRSQRVLNELVSRHIRETSDLPNRGDLNVAVMKNSLSTVSIHKEVYEAMVKPQHHQPSLIPIARYNKSSDVLDKLVLLNDEKINKTLLTNVNLTPKSRNEVIQTIGLVNLP